MTLVEALCKNNKQLSDAGAYRLLLLDGSRLSAAEARYRWYRYKLEYRGNNRFGVGYKLKENSDQCNCSKLLQKRLNSVKEKNVYHLRYGE